MSWVLSQKGELVPNKVDLKTAPLINEVLKEVETQIISKQIQLTLEGESVEFKADKDYLALIVRNLLTNAIKFSKVGGKVILSTSTDKNLVVFSVQDFGIVMSPSKME